MPPVPPEPFGVITSPDGRWVFVSDSRGITVLRTGAAAASPTVVRSVPLPRGQSGLGEALTPDGRYLLVAAMSETAVLNVGRLESGSAQPVVGSLSAPGGAIEVVTSLDGRFAFTSLEGTGAVEVADLARALSAGFRAGGVTVGQVPAAFAPVGEAVSPDGRWLYVTSEVRRLRGRPALVGQTRAGSFPRQFALSPDGRTLYVTNFASSQLETIRVANLVSAVKPGAAQR